MEGVIRELGSALALLSTARHPDDGVTDTLLQAMSSLTKYTREVDLNIEAHLARETQALHLVEELKKVTKKQKTMIQSLQRAADDAVADAADSAAAAAATTTAANEAIERAKEEAQIAIDTAVTAEQNKREHIGTNTSVLDTTSSHTNKDKDTDTDTIISMLRSDLQEAEQRSTAYQSEIHIHEQRYNDIIGKLSKKDNTISRLKELLSRSDDLLQAQYHMYTSHTSYTGNGSESDRHRGRDSDRGKPPAHLRRPIAKQYNNYTQKQEEQQQEDEGEYEYNVNNSNNDKHDEIIDPLARFGHGKGTGFVVARSASAPDLQDEEEDIVEEEADHSESGTDEGLDDEHEVEECSDRYNRDNKEKTDDFDPLARFGHGLFPPVVARSASAPDLDMGERTPSISGENSPRSDVPSPFTTGLPGAVDIISVEAQTQASADGRTIPFARPPDLPPFSPTNTGGKGACSGHGQAHKLDPFEESSIRDNSDNDNRDNQFGLSLSPLPLSGQEQDVDVSGNGDANAKVDDASTPASASKHISLAEQGDIKVEDSFELIKNYY